MASFLRFGGKLREEISFKEFANFCTFHVLLSGLTQGTSVSNFKRFGRNMREEIGF